MLISADVRENLCKTIINKIDVPGFTFRWALTPYRGCRHACRYCYARPSHEFLNLNQGDDFDQRIFVKVNASRVLRQELLKPRWQGESIVIGTESNRYEPAAGRVCITRRILKVMAELKTQLV